MSFHDEFVEVGGFAVVEPLECAVVDDEQVDRDMQAGMLLAISGLDGSRR